MARETAVVAEELPAFLRQRLVDPYRFQDVLGSVEVAELVFQVSDHVAGFLVVEVVSRHPGPRVERVGIAEKGEHPAATVAGGHLRELRSRSVALSFHRVAGNTA